MFAFEGVVDGEWLLTAKSVGQTLADTEVGAVFKRSSGRSVENADLHAIFAVGLGLERAATRVADFADEDGRLAKIELVALDLEIILIVWNVLVDA